jgi:hypothetical protein
MFPFHLARHERCWLFAPLLLLATPAIAKPAQIPGQPPIVKVKRPGVKPYWLQVFDVDAKDVPLTGDISVAARHYSWQGQTPPAGPVTVVVDCDVDVADGIRPCVNRTVADKDEALARVAVRQLMPRRPSFPTVPALQKDQEKWLPDPLSTDKQPLRRVARFTYRLDPADVKVIDPMRGPLVESPNLPELKGRFSPISYPAAREAQGLSANVTVECQVQEDLSIICGSATVDPPEHARWFAEPVRQKPIFWRSAPKLPDGRDARGVRFRKTVRFMWGG